MHFVGNSSLLWRHVVVHSSGCHGVRSSRVVTVAAIPATVEATRAEDRCNDCDDELGNAHERAQRVERNGAGLQLPSADPAVALVRVGKDTGCRALVRDDAAATHRGENGHDEVGDDHAGAPGLGTDS